MIFLLPYQQMISNNSALADFAAENNSWENIFPDSDLMFFQEGKTAINYLMHELKFSRQDEIAILTTTDSSFVSSCVTCNLFNFSRISREIGPDTKMIFVIHEFGFPYKKIEEAATIANKRGIPLVEDVAHSFDSFLNGKRLGSFGDYSIYSLPKSFPMEKGGLLAGKNLPAKNPWFTKTIHDKILKESLLYLPYLKSFTNRRMENYSYFSEKFSSYGKIFDLKGRINPFVFGFHTLDSEVVYSNLHKTAIGFELHPCYVRDWVVLPVNQFITEPQLILMTKKILTLIQDGTD
jgi:perosamine synthetase